MLFSRFLHLPTPAGIIAILFTNILIVPAAMEVHLAAIAVRRTSVHIIGILCIVLLREDKTNGP